MKTRVGLFYREPPVTPTHPSPALVLHAQECYCKHTLEHISRAQDQARDMPLSHRLSQIKATRSVRVDQAYLPPPLPSCVSRCTTER